MIKFLRFDISGVSAIFWFVLFLSPYIDPAKLTSANGEKVIVAFLGSIIFSIPLGLYIHQISISLLSPFRKTRFFNQRKVLDDLKKLSDEMYPDAFDKKNQSILVFAKALRPEIEIDQTNKLKVGIDIKYITEEISNRYSYYYVRIENGIIAPIIGYLLFDLTYSILSGCSFIRITPSIWKWTVPMAAILQGIVLVMYIPALFREVDDIERHLLSTQSSVIKTYLKKMPNNYKASGCQ